MKKSKTQILFDIIFIIIIITSNLLVGTPIKYNIYAINFLLTIVMIITLIRQEIKINKIDICVIVISLSTFIPLITNQYVRLGDTVEYILRYISVLNIYFITRNYIQNNEKRISIISNSIIIMSIFMIIFGIDMMNKNILEKFYEFLGTAWLANENPMRMMSLYKYSNTLSVFIGFSIFLSLERYINEKRPKLKSIYPVCIFIQIFGLIMTYSRMCWIISAILIIFYVISIKENRKDLIKIISISFLNAVIFYILYNYLDMIGNTWLIIIPFLLQSIIEYVVVFKLEKIQITYKLKKIIIAITIAIIATIVIILSILPSKLTLFNYENAETKYRRQNIKVEAETDYNLKLKINAKTNKENNFKIYIKELDINEEEIEEQEVEFDNYNGIKEINFKTHDNTDTISITFKCSKPDAETKLEVEEVTLNDKKIKIYYPLIPIELINRLERIKMDTASIRIRLSYIKESMLIIKDHWLFGQGGNAWKYVEKQDSSIEGIAEHSYPMQLFIQNGIVAFIAYILLIIFLVKRMHKNKNITLKSIWFALLLVLLHSLLDFDMSFLNILLITYMYIAILNEKTLEKDKNFNFNTLMKVVYVVILGVILYFNIGEIATYYMDTSKIENQGEKLNMINLKIVLSPYDYRYYRDKTNCLITIKNTNQFNKESEEYKNICRKIIKTNSFITEIEKYKNPYTYNTIMLNKIELINEENKTQTLDEIEKIWKQYIGDNQDIYNGIEMKLSEKLNNEETQKFLEKLKTTIKNEEIYE